MATIFTCLQRCFEHKGLHSDKNHVWKEDQPRVFVQLTFCFDRGMRLLCFTNQLLVLFMAEENEGEFSYTQRI